MDTKSDPVLSTGSTGTVDSGTSDILLAELNQAVRLLSDINRQSASERGGGGDHHVQTSTQSTGVKKTLKRNKIQFQKQRADTRIPCVVCKTPGILMCAGCDNVWYCGVRHLQEDWTRHRIKCFPMTRVEEDGDTKVKYLQSTRDLRKGSIIIYENAYFSFADPTIDFGEKISHNVDAFSYLNNFPAKVVCVGCFNEIDTTYAKIFNCTICQSPVCKVECAELYPHANFECAVLKTCLIGGRESVENTLEGRPFALQVFYDFVAVLRVLLLERTDTRSWLQFERLMFPNGNDQIRFGKNSHTLQQQEIISSYEKLFRNLGRQAGSREDKDTENAVDFCFRILNVLKRRGMAHGSGTGSFQRSLSPKASYIEHSCLPNVDICVSIKGEIMVKALRQIQKGDKIVAGFVNLLRPTYDRRLLLQIHRYADCFCQRCLDPTEMETYFGSLKCYNLGGCSRVGFFILENVENLGCFDKALIWKCQLCEFRTTHFYIVDRVLNISIEMFQPTSEGEWYHNLSQNKLSKLLGIKHIHGTHFLAFAYKRTRANLFGYKLESSSIRSLSGEDFRLKIRMCDEVSSLMEKIELGFSTLNADTIHELLNVLCFKNNYSTPRRASTSTSQKEVVFNLACKLWNAVNHCDPETPLGDFSRAAESIIQASRVSPVNYRDIVNMFGPVKLNGLFVSSVETLMESTMKSILVFNHLNDIIYLNCSTKLVQHVAKLAAAKGLVSSEYSTPYGKGKKAIDPNILIQLFSPLVTSHRFMKEQFKNPYNSIQCEDGTNIVFQDFMGFIFLQIGTEDLPFLRRSLGVCISYVSSICGPDVSILKSSRYHAELLDTLLATWTSLYFSDQSFLIEAVEQMHVNIQVSSALNKSLTQTAAKVKSWGSGHVHAILFMETKLLSWHSTRRSQNLSPDDLMFFITLCQKDWPLNLCSKNGEYEDSHFLHSSSSEAHDDSRTRTTSLGSSTNGERSGSSHWTTSEESQNYIEHYFILLKSGANFVPYRVHVGVVQDGLYLLYICECPLSPLTNICATLQLTHKFEESRRNVPKDKQYFELLDSSVKKVLDSLKKLKNTSLRNDLVARWERLKLGFTQYVKTGDCITLQLSPLIDVLRESFRTYFSEKEKLKGVINSELEAIWRTVQSDTSDFWSFLKVKSCRNTILGSKETLTISKYLEEFPGLVHFIYVERSRHWVTMPSLNSTKDDTVKLRNSHVWGMVNFAREHMQQGHFSLMWKDNAFNYAYFLWFEDPSSQPIRAKHVHGLPLETYPLPGILCGDFYKRLIAERFPGVLSSKIRCLELFCIHLGLATSSCVLEHSKRLATTICEVTGTTNDLT